MMTHFHTIDLLLTVVACLTVDVRFNYWTLMGLTMVDYKVTARQVISVVLLAKLFLANNVLTCGHLDL